MISQRSKTGVAGIVATRALACAAPAFAPAFLDRRELLDFGLLYLFSYDVELDLDRQEKMGKFPGGVRMNLFARRDLSRVYNVGREATIAGSGVQAISGRVEWGGDAAYLRDDDIASSDIRVVVHTDDRAIIHMSYHLLGYVGAGGIARIVTGTGRDRYGTEDHPYEVPIMTSPRFETSAPNYRWLNEIQGIGFARAQLVRSKFRRITTDVYALS
jgi:hypothetical protein